MKDRNENESDELLADEKIFQNMNMMESLLYVLKT